MPTARPRHMITETDHIARAISLGEALWPELKGDRAGSLRKILEVGILEIEDQLERQKSSRQKKIESVAGSMSDVWPANWRQELRDEWPE